MTKYRCPNCNEYQAIKKLGFSLKVKRYECQNCAHVLTVMPGDVPARPEPIINKGSKP